MKEEALDRTVWRARFGIGFGPVIRQTSKGMNDYRQFILNKIHGVESFKITGLLIFCVCMYYVFMFVCMYVLFM